MTQSCTATVRAAELVEGGRCPSRPRRPRRRQLQATGIRHPRCLRPAGDWLSTSGQIICAVVGAGVLRQARGFAFLLRGRWRGSSRQQAHRNAHQLPAPCPPVQPLLLNGSAGMGGRHRNYAAICGEASSGVWGWRHKQGVAHAGAAVSVATRLGGGTQAWRPAWPRRLLTCPPPRPSILFAVHHLVHQPAADRRVHF